MALGGKRVKRKAQGNCLFPDCGRPMRADNLCNRHYLKDYFNTHPRLKYEGRRTRKAIMVEDVASITGLSLEKSTQIFNLVFSQIKSALKKGEEVRIRGFGTFFTHNRPVKAYGPRVVFKPSTALRYMVNHNAD